MKNSNSVYSWKMIQHLFQKLYIIFYILCNIYTNRRKCLFVYLLAMARKNYRAQMTEKFRCEYMPSGTAKLETFELVCLRLYFLSFSPFIKAVKFQYFSLIYKIFSLFQQNISGIFTYIYIFFIRHKILFVKPIITLINN